MQLITGNTPRASEEVKNAITLAIRNLDNLTPEQREKLYSIALSHACNNQGRLPHFENLAHLVRSQTAQAERETFNWNRYLNQFSL
jgi:hypothetical protein